MSSTVKARPAGSRSTATILMEFLGSMNLAITLLVAVAIASVIGTVLQQNQPYNDYIIKFGPFWHEFFKGLGLYDVYSASWFLFILGFLVVSTSVCVSRHAPVMLRDMRSFRLNVQAKSLRTFHHKEERTVAEDEEAVLDRASRLLTGHGYRVRSKDHGEHRVLSAMKGGSNRLGYLFTHTAIIVILVGGLVDCSNIHLRVAELSGDLERETRNVPASEVPEASRVGPGNPSFRGSVNVTEGTRANVVFLGMRDGYLVQELPFAVEVKDFRVEHYSTGQPKSFESDLVIHDDALQEPLEATIAVNHPLIYKGHAIYQASFGDGGSRLGLRLWPLDTQRIEPLTMWGQVFENHPLKTPDGVLSLEIDDFRLFNINPVVNEQGETEQRNMGPSFTFKLRDEAGVAREYQNYMNPVEQEGRFFFISGMRTEVSEPFRYLHIPMDSNGGVERFMAFLTYLQDPELVAEVAERTTQHAMGAAQMEDNEALRQQVADSMVRLIALFTKGGFEAIVQEMVAGIPEDQREAATDAFLKVLRTGLQSVYLRMLADQGVSGDEADWRFFEDAMNAIAVLPFYGTPYYLQLSQFEHVEASGLQITKSPGKNVVYFGSVLLTIGVFMLFYLAHRRVWVWVQPTEDGSRVVFAGTANRNVLEFEKQFERLKEGLFSGLSAK